jgi:hypothetical protein
MRCIDQARRSFGVQIGRVEEAEWDQKMGRRVEERKSGRRREAVQKEGSPVRQP